MTRSQIEEEKNLIFQQIHKYVPLLRPFFEIGDTLENFSSKLYDFPVAEEHQDRQKMVVTHIKNKFRKLFAKNFESLNLNFSGNLAYNIADHHMVLSHPFLISANIVSSAKKLLQNEKQDAIIVISSGDVPPNNYFSKGGFIFHGKRVPLFSVSEREYSSYYIPKRDLDPVRRLKDIGRWKDFDHEEQRFLQDEENFLGSIDFSNCRDYADQITHVVNRSWPRLFSVEQRNALPELLYITQEELTTECLIELLQSDNMISSTLFDSGFRESVLNNFRGIVTTWREDEGKGTHFFWRKYPGQPRSLRVWVQGNKLVPEDPRFASLAIPLEKQPVIELLKSREIYPSLFMIFSVLNFYAGIRPLTGFGSAVYLHLIKDAWLETLRNAGMKDEAELVNDVETNGLIAGLVLTYQRTMEKIQTLYAHDIFANGGMSREYLKRILDLKYRDVFSVGIADMYDYFRQKYIPKNEWIEKKITFDDLATLVFDWIK